MLRKLLNTNHISLLCQRTKHNSEHMKGMQFVMLEDVLDAGACYCNCSRHSMTTSNAQAHRVQPIAMSFSKDPAVRYFQYRS